MKKYLLSVLVLAITLTSFSQPYCKTKPLYFEIAMGGIYSNYNEKGLNLDLGVFKFGSKLYPSVNADTYTAKVNDRHWTTAQAGVRLNFVLDNFVLSAGPKYVTQGNERSAAYNQWVFDGAVSWLYLISQRDEAYMWLKVSAQYNSTPENRVFGLIGLQFAVR